MSSALNCGSLCIHKGVLSLFLSKTNITMPTLTFSNLSLNLTTNDKCTSSHSADDLHHNYSGLSGHLRCFWPSVQELLEFCSAQTAIICLEKSCHLVQSTIRETKSLGSKCAKRELLRGFINPKVKFHPPDCNLIPLSSFFPPLPPASLFTSS